MMVLLSDTLEASRNVENVSQEALVSAFDEETQAAQEKKDEPNIAKDSIEEPVKSVKSGKDSSNQKPPKETEKVTFKDIVQTSVANEKSEVKKDTDGKEVPENLPTDHSRTKIDTTQPVKLATKDYEADITEKGQVSVEKEANRSKGIKRSLEEDTEEPAGNEEVQEGRGKRPRNNEPAVDSSPQPLEQEEQDTLQEEEAEPMEAESTRDLESESGIQAQKRVELEGVGKADDGSRDGEGDEVGEEDAEKKDNSGQEKDKDDSKEDEESSAPSRKRKKKKRSYERPRGEGGKFMKEKPGTV